MRIALKAVFATLATGSLLQIATAADGQPAMNDKEKASYAIGLNFGNVVKRNNFDSNSVSVEMIAKGISDFLSGNIGLTQDEAQSAINSYQAALQQVVGNKNLEEGMAFLAANKEKEGVRILPVTMPDGSTNELQYKVIAEGSGPSPSATDKVKVHYRGTVINGTEFDSSYQRGQPAEFPLNAVIRGWTEALQHMKVGSKWQLFIPPGLAYAERGAPGTPIGPHSTLIFEVELLDIAEAQPAASAAPAMRQVTSDIIKVEGTNIQVIKASDLPAMTNQAPN